MKHGGEREELHLQLNFRIFSGIVCLLSEIYLLALW
jgi:hypothetical protein